MTRGASSVSTCSAQALGGPEVSVDAGDDRDDQLSGQQAQQARHKPAHQQQADRSRRTGQQGGQAARTAAPAYSSNSENSSLFLKPDSIRYGENYSLNLVISSYQERENLFAQFDYFKPLRAGGRCRAERAHAATARRLRHSITLKELRAGDTLGVSELPCLGRSMAEYLELAVCTMRAIYHTRWADTCARPLSASSGRLLSAM